LQLQITTSGKSTTDYELRITNVMNGEWLIENSQP